MPVKQQPRSALSQGSWRSILCRGCEARPAPPGPRSTYIRGRALVRTGAGEGDELMAPLVHHKAANCKENTGTRSGARHRHHESQEVTQQTAAVSGSRAPPGGFLGKPARQIFKPYGIFPNQTGHFGKTQQNKVLSERQSRAGNTSVALSSLSLVAHALRSPPGTKRGRIWRSRVSELKSACGQKWKIVPKGTGGQFSSHSSAFLQHLPSLRLPDQKTRTSSSPHTRQCQPRPSGSGTGTSIPMCHCRIPCRISRANPPHSHNHQTLSARASLKLPALFLQFVQPKLCISRLIFSPNATYAL